MTRSRNTVDFIAPTLFIIILLAVWELLVQDLSIPEWILPGPIRILKTFWETAPLMLRHAQITMVECLIGFMAAIIFSFIIAFIMDEIPLIRKSVYPLIITSQTVPIISVAPLFIIWFGYGILPKIMVVALVCFFPITISLLNGLAAVDKDYLALLKSMNAGRLDTFRMVKLPLSLPAFFAGIKISAAYSVMGAVIGEWLGAQAGLGTYMTLAQHSFQVDRVFAVILTITLLSLILFYLIVMLENLLIPWNNLSEK